MAAQLTNPWVAVKPIGDRLGQARALRRVHEAFHAGRDVAGELRGVVAQSWARSGKAGIDPLRHLAPIVMDDRELQERWAAHPLFLYSPCCAICSAAPRTSPRTCWSSPTRAGC